MQKRQLQWLPSVVGTQDNLGDRCLNTCDADMLICCTQTRRVGESLDLGNKSQGNLTERLSDRMLASISDVADWMQVG